MAGIIETLAAHIQAVADAYAKDKSALVPAAGYFTLRSASDGRILFVAEIGDNPSEKFAGRCFNSQEKGERLFKTANELGHYSSWQSRDPEHATVKKWGGAILTPDFIPSFSGLPELADETLVALLAVKLRWTTPGDAWKILAISENDIGQDFMEKIGL